MILPDSNKSRNVLQWGASKAFALKAARAFLSNKPCAKLNKKEAGRTSDQNEVYCSSRKVIIFYTTAEQSPSLYSIGVLGENWNLTMYHNCSS